jgi:hypothetical protein
MLNREMSPFGSNHVAEGGGMLQLVQQSESMLTNHVWLSDNKH